MSAGPQLSSLASSLDELTDKIMAIAEQHAGTPRDHIALSLYEVERSLTAASRKLAKVVDELTSNG